MKEPIRDIPYASQSERQKLDMYLPDDDGSLHPAVLWLHPGGFSMGSKDIMIDVLAPSLTGRGYAVAAANYRLVNEAIFPAQILDAKAAVRWIRANASKYQINPEKIAAWGCSAGATLAVLLGTSANVMELEDLSMGNPTESSAVNAVINWYAPVDLLNIDTQLVNLGYPAIHNTKQTGLFEIVGGSGPGLAEKCEVLNPTTYIKGSAPPFYIQHGNKDNTVPITQSLKLAETLSSVLGNEKVAVNIIEDADHFSVKHQSQENINKILDFLDKCLK